MIKSDDTREKVFARNAYEKNNCNGHVRCRLCGAVADIPPVAMGEPEDTAGYLLEDCAVEYCGLCPDCLNRQKEKPLSPPEGVKKV